MRVPLHSPRVRIPSSSHMTRTAILLDTLIMDSVTKCTSCTRVYSINRLPLKLPCKHTVCGDCLSKTYNAEVFHCPICGVEDAIPLDELPVQKVIYQAMMKKHSSVCEDHRKRIHWYCERCAKLVCKHCVSKHAGHNFVDVTDAQVMEMINERISTAEAESKSALTEVSTAKSKLVDILQQLEKQRSRTLQGISTTSKQIRGEIKELTRLALREVSSLYASTKSVYSVKLNEVSEEEMRRNEAYQDFVSTVGNMKALDVCSQLKFVQRLSSLSISDKHYNEMPQGQCEEMMAEKPKFIHKLKELLQESEKRLELEAAKGDDEGDLIIEKH